MDTPFRHPPYRPADWPPAGRASALLRLAAAAGLIAAIVAALESASRNAEVRPSASIAQGARP